MDKSNQIIKVAIVDDHALYRAGVKTALSGTKDVRVIAEAENGLHFLNMLKDGLEVDVILLDIQMPVMDGITVLPEIKKSKPEIKVIMLTMMDDNSMISKMMEIGANSYLTKTSHSEIIYEAIKTCFVQEYYFNTLTNKALRTNLKQRNDLTPQRMVQEEAHWNEKEILILKLMCDEKSTKEISDLVDLSPRTVEATRDKLKVKTGAKSTAGLIIYAIKHNILEDDIDYDIKEQKVSLRKEKYLLSNEQMAKLFSLSTSILVYINHDLSGQKNALFYALTQIKDDCETKKNNQIEPLQKEVIENILMVVFDALSKIGSINNLIKSHFYWSNKIEKVELNTLFISNPAQIVKIVQERYQEIKILISKDSILSLEFVYPPQILIAILTELIGNAKKNTKTEVEIRIRWYIVENEFYYEVHDNGTGFLQIINPENIFAWDAFAPLINKETKMGFGLKIINNTVQDSGGTLFFSRSNILGGAMILFKLPILSFKQKASKKEKISALTKEQMTKLFGLSTSILDYINHDLAGQTNVLYSALSKIKTGFDHKKYGYKSDLNWAILLERGLDAVKKINSISAVIKSHFHGYDSKNSENFNKLFVSKPSEIISIVRKRYKDVEIEISKSSPQDIEIVYPPQILLAILSELTENANKSSGKSLKLYVDWRMSGKVFQCEFHDNGPGFSGIKDRQFVPLGFQLQNSPEKGSGLGLGIINRTILDSDGHLFFSNSKLLDGALIYFEFPIINFTYLN